MGPSPSGQPFAARGLYPWAQWTVKLPKTWAAMLPGLLTYGLLFGLALCPEGRVFNPLQQYRGVFPGDLFAWMAIGVALYNAKTILPRRNRFYTTRAYRRTMLIVALVFGLGLLSLDVTNTIANPHGTLSYTAAQLWSPTHIAHTVVLPFLMYVGLSLIPAVWADGRARYRWLVRVAMAVGVVGWVICAIVLDNVLPRPNLANIHPLDGGWFGGWWPGLGNDFVIWLVHVTLHPLFG